MIVKHPANGEAFATRPLVDRPLMRGTVAPKGTDPDWPAHRRWRKAARRMARASRRTNR